MGVQACIGLGVFYTPGVEAVEPIMGVHFPTGVWCSNDSSTP